MGRRTREREADACAAAHALTLVGDRWALLVVRELLLGPKRFTDLREGLISISPNVLTQRLEDLEGGGVVRRRKLEPPANTWVYELTDWGRDLEPVILALGRWGVRSPFFPPVGASVSVDSLVLSFRTMFSSEEARDFDATLELRLGEERFRATVGRGRLTIERGAAIDPDAVISGDVMAVASVTYFGRKLTAAIDAGDLRVDGSRSIARRFLSLFPMPERATLAS